MEEKIFYYHLLLEHFIKKETVWVIPDQGKGDNKREPRANDVDEITYAGKARTPYN